MKIAVMGYGTIGSGVVEALSMNQDSISKKVGQPVEVKYVLDLRDFPGDPVQEKIVHDVSVIEKDPEVGIVVETMGGTKPAYDFVKAMILAGKAWRLPTKRWWPLMARSFCIWPEKRA